MSPFARHAVLGCFLVLAAGCSRKEAPFSKGVPPAGPAGPKEIRLLIVGDGFTSSQAHVRAFNNRVAAVKTAFLTLPGVAAAGAQLVTKEVLLVSQSTGVSTIMLGYSGQNIAGKCSFTYGDTIPIITKMEKPFGADYYMVIFGSNGGVGCADGTSMFILADTQEPNLQHEMGHALAGLYDEIGGKAGTPPPAEGRNCTDDPSKPPFDADSPKPGCHGYDQLFRLTDGCRMLSGGNTVFCDVCKPILQKAFLPPPAPPGTPAGALDVTAVLYDTGKVMVSNAVEARPGRLPPEVITGDTFAVVKDGAGKIVGVAPLSMDDGMEMLKSADAGGRVIDLRVRAYTGALAEELVPVSSRILRITLRGVKKEDVLKEGYKLTLDIRHVENGRASLFVDAATIAKLQGHALFNIDLAGPIRSQLESR